MVLDTLDGFLARADRTRRRRFGVELDSLADVVSFGAGAGDPGVPVGPVAGSGGSAGPPASSIVTAAAMRLARFNIQTATVDRQALLRRHCRARRPRGVIASTVFLYPWGLQDARAAVPALRDGARARRC